VGLRIYSLLMPFTLQIPKDQAVKSETIMTQYEALLYHTKDVEAALIPAKQQFMAVSV